MESPTQPLYFSNEALPQRQQNQNTQWSRPSPPPQPPHRFFAERQQQQQPSRSFAAAASNNKTSRLLFRSGLRVKTCRDDDDETSSAFKGDEFPHFESSMDFLAQVESRGSGNEVREKSFF